MKHSYKTKTSKQFKIVNCKGKAISYHKDLMNAKRAYKKYNPLHYNIVCNEQYTISKGLSEEQDNFNDCLLDAIEQNNRKIISDFLKGWR